MPWLPVASLTREEQGKLAALILEGAFEGGTPLSALLPPALHAKLSLDARSLVRELCLQVLGKPAQIIASTETLDSGESESESESDVKSKADPKVDLSGDRLAVRTYRRFLRGFAFNRLGKYQDALTEWAELERSSKDLYASYRPRMRIEEGIDRLNHGEYRAAIDLIEPLLNLPEPAFDVYSCARLLGGLAYCYIYLGRYNEAERCLESQERLIRANPSPAIGSASARMRITFHLEKDEFARAQKRLASTLERVPPNSVNHAFLVQLKLRIDLAENDLDAAEATLEQLQALTDQIQLPLGVLNYIDERVDLLLRRKRGREALNEITGALAEAEDRGDNHARFRHLMFRARAAAAEGGFAEGLRYIDETIALGEQKGYGPELVWAFFHAAGMALNSQSPVRFKMYLARGKRLADQLGLRVRSSCFGYLIEYYENRYDRASSLVSLVTHQEIGIEVEYFLSLYGLLNDRAITVSDGARSEMIREPDLRRRLFSEPGTFWFQKEGVLVTHGIGRGGADRISVVEFTPGSPVLAGFKMLLGARDGLTLRDFHQARSPHPFREELHASASKMLISRIRAQIAKCGLVISFDRNTSRYRLTGEYPVLTIHVKVDDHGIEEVTPAKRLELILQRIALEAFVTTAALCEEFKMSRQALHPYLKKLVASGRIRLIRKGPISGYRKTAY